MKVKTSVSPMGFALLTSGVYGGSSALSIFIYYILGKRLGWLTLICIGLLIGVIIYHMINRKLILKKGGRDCLSPRSVLKKD
jgi:hypothetical protein